MSPPKCAVEHDGIIVNLSYSEEAFSFKDFDYYVRRKFKLMDSTVLRYCTEAENWKDDILPNANILKNIGKLRIMIDYIDGFDGTRGNGTGICSEITPKSTTRKVFTPSSHTSAIMINTSHIAARSINTKGGGSRPAAHFGTPAADDEYVPSDTTNSSSSSTSANTDDDDCPNTQDKRAEPFTPIPTTAGNKAAQYPYQRRKANSNNSKDHNSNETETATTTTLNTITRSNGSLIYGIRNSSLNLHSIAYYTPYIIIVLLSIILAPKSATNHTIYKIFDKLDEFVVKVIGLPSSGISQTEWRILFIEVYVTFVVRCFTELFIRRVLNPENDIKKVFYKFSIDACFAGFSAGAFVIIRKVAISNLK